MANFEAALKVVLEHEGGFVADPADPGGATKWGVSLAFLRRNGYDIDSSGEIDVEDIRSLTPAQAREIYFKHFWEPVHGSRIENQALATKLFDMAVNLGPSTAIRLLQRCLRTHRRRLAIDGVMGPATRNAIAATEPRVLLALLMGAQEEYYEELIDKNRSLGKFMAGWRKRAEWGKQFLEPNWKSEVLT